jgi:hypothetical protein
LINPRILLLVELPLIRHGKHFQPFEVVIEGVLFDVAVKIDEGEEFELKSIEDVDVNSADTGIE